MWIFKWRTGGCVAEAQRASGVFGESVTQEEKVQGPFRKVGLLFRGVVSFFPKDELPPVHIFLRKFSSPRKTTFYADFFYIGEKGDVWTEGESLKQVRPKVGKWDRWDYFPSFPRFISYAQIHYADPRKKQLRYCFLWTRWPPCFLVCIFWARNRITFLKADFTWQQKRVLLPYGFQNKRAFCLLLLCLFPRTHSKHPKPFVFSLADYVIVSPTIPAKNKVCRRKLFSPRKQQR